MRRLFRGAATMVCLITLLIASALIPAQAATGGQIRVTLSGPSHLPSSVLLLGSQNRIYTASKSEGVASTSVLIDVPVGVYLVVARPIVDDGRVYVATSTLELVTVKAGRTTELKSTYTLSDVIKDLHAADIQRTGVKLTWSAKAGTRLVVRRFGGMVEAGGRDLGRNVPVSGSTAIDTGLASGTRYTYAVFAENAGR